ncbi:hypothetical protein GUITHDRAFT_102165 [Guillardia theta CCMP2712]|uniref:Uncharacterized protein n=1 Tax=Guillardia theta (strain CCMP2712) TaxID=905079 RepID=L1JW02_GUITC|nr:hypothetical protein GUITHDRAFT_102165 [Guillardia theta CCMP2712]EKX52263.1 hypothetical protein GUITHDRAFT_102165 [Guillardia theta CCMP2712]|eukprot:XP_005839243.1 hypothetical protein GUITHDRAFT_102165 [Guillardia theta CCMP2712]
MIAGMRAVIAYEGDENAFGMRTRRRACGGGNLEMAEELMELLLDIMAGGEKGEAGGEDEEGDVSDTANMADRSAGGDEISCHAQGDRHVEQQDRARAKGSGDHNRRGDEPRLAEISAWLRAHPHVGVNGRERSSGITALCMAAANGRMDVTSLLLEEKADVNLESTDTGNMPIHFACMRGSLHIVKTLVEHRADATASSQSHVVDWLLTPESKYVLCPDRKKVDVNKQGTTPLIAASGQSNIKLLQTILDQGSCRGTISHANNNGNTALHVAALQRNGRGCELLIEARASLIALNKRGQSPMDIARASNDEALIQLFEHHLRVLNDEAVRIANALLEDEEQKASEGKTKKKKKRAKNTCKKNTGTGDEPSDKVKEVTGDDTIPRSSHAVAEASADDDDDDWRGNMDSVSEQATDNNTEIGVVRADPEERREDHPAERDSENMQQGVQRRGSQRGKEEKAKEERSRQAGKQGEKRDERRRNNQRDEGKREQPGRANVKHRGEDKVGAERGPGASRKPHPAGNSKKAAGQEAQEALERALLSVYPLANDLALRPHHVLGMELSELSASQLEALEEVHRNLMARIEEARLELVRAQERERVQQELGRRLFLEQHSAGKKFWFE